jgi:hypothetical protein
MSFTRSRPGEPHRPDGHGERDLPHGRRNRGRIHPERSAGLGRLGGAGAERWNVDTGSADLLAELERLVSALSQRVAELGDKAAGEDPVDRLQREKGASAARTAAEPAALQQASAPFKQLPPEAVAALARVLSGTTKQVYVCRAAQAR